MGSCMSIQREIKEEIEFQNFNRDFRMAVKIIKEVENEIKKSTHHPQ